MKVAQEAQMKVLLVSESLGRGGVQSVMLQFAEFVDHNRFVVSAFMPERAGDGVLAEGFRRLGADAVEAPRRSRYDLRFVAALVRHVRQARPDAVHVHMHDIYACEHLFLPLRAAGVPVLVATDHVDPHVRATLEPARALLKRANLRICDMTFAVSRPLEAMLRERFGAPPERVLRIGNGVDVARFASATPDPALRAGLGAAPGDFVVLGAARLEGQKGFEFLIDAAALLRPRLPGLRIWIAGDGRLHKALTKQIAAKGLDGVIRLLGSRGDVPTLLATADAYALPSLFEGLPLGVIEAMAAGKPTVATAVSGTPDLIDDGRTGLLVPPRDANALAGAIERLATDTPLRRALAAAAAARAPDFDVRAVVAQISDRLLQILARKRGSRAADAAAG